MNGALSDFLTRLTKLPWVHTGQLAASALTCSGAASNSSSSRGYLPSISSRTKGGAAHHVAEQVDPVFCAIQRHIEKSALFSMRVGFGWWLQRFDQRVVHYFRWQPIPPFPETQNDDVVRFFAFGAVDRILF